MRGGRLAEAHAFFTALHNGVVVMIAGWLLGGLLRPRQSGEQKQGNHGNSSHRG
jgi:hypothetical protein